MSKTVSTRTHLREKPESVCEAKKSWLITWIGAADHESSEAKRGKDLGPIATALLGGTGYDRVYLLTNYDFERSRAYCDWLEYKTGYKSESVDLYGVDLLSPINYADIYEQVSNHLAKAGLPNDGVDLTFHVSPGTPAMAAIWIILAKTRFPARLIQTSRENGVEAIDFLFDLADDFLPEFLKRSSQRARRLADAAVALVPEFAKVIHSSSAMAEQIQLARRIASYDVPVLILGETGTGKELFAEAIHAASPRRSEPFVAVNCGAISSELANSELFGHKKGAFTGATFDRAGHFAEAGGGTLFLDEVGDLPLDTQVRLLRALQSKEITPLGQSKPVKFSARILAATHKNLIQEVANGRFREDLFHRLAVGILQLPPLRERGTDLDVLIDHFLVHINADSQGHPEGQSKILGAAARRALHLHHWPGNVRELYHTLLRATIWSGTIEISDLDVRAAMLFTTGDQSMQGGLHMADGFDLQSTLDDVAKGYIRRAMERSGQRKAQAAKLLGFANHQTLGNWMKRLRLD
jgi:DNA-binding NtrC family response regulator